MNDLGDDKIFRSEALEAFQRSEDELAEYLHLAPVWRKAVYWLLVLAAVALFGVLIFGRVSTYARGPVIIRSHAITQVVASAAGAVTSVLISPGDRVEAGQRLAELKGAGDIPSVVYAPVSGVITDLRARAGQQLAAGDVLFALNTADEKKFYAQAFLPTERRALLKAGMPIRIAIEGLTHAYLDLRVDQISGVAVTGNEVSRVLGREIDQPFSLTGTFFAVTAEITPEQAERSHQALTLHEGMLARADVLLDRERVGLLLVPWLRERMHDNR
jgi:hypothetical protein